MVSTIAKLDSMPLVLLRERRKRACTWSSFSVGVSSSPPLSSPLHSGSVRSAHHAAVERPQCVDGVGLCIAAAYFRTIVGRYRVSSQHVTDFVHLATLKESGLSGMLYDGSPQGTASVQQVQAGAAEVEPTFGWVI